MGRLRVRRAQMGGDRKKRGAFRGWACDNGWVRRCEARHVGVGYVMVGEKRRRRKAFMGAEVSWHANCQGGPQLQNMEMQNDVLICYSLFFLAAFLSLIESKKLANYMTSFCERWALSPSSNSCLKFLCRFRQIHSVLSVGSFLLIWARGQSRDRPIAVFSSCMLSQFGFHSRPSPSLT